MQVTVVAGCAVAFIATQAGAVGPKICIPNASGVPFLPGGPNWWTTSTDPNVQRFAESFDINAGRTNDPRWAGGLAVGYAKGATDPAEFRALVHDGNLLLSWSSRDFPFNVGLTGVTVGFQTNSSVQPVAVRVSLTTDNTSSNGIVKPLGCGDGNGKACKHSWYKWDTGDTWVTNDTPPAWEQFAENSTRVWINPSTSKVAFTIQMAVPIGPSGLNVTGDKFFMWYSLQPSVPALIPNANPNIISWSWPRGQENDTTYYFYDQLGTYGKKHIPNPDKWGEIGIGKQTDCAGVTLAAMNVGVRNQQYGMGSWISINDFNTFYALPKNESGEQLDMSDTKASFYFGNWGAQLGTTTQYSWTPLQKLDNVSVNSTSPLDPDVALENSDKKLIVPDKKLAQVATDPMLLTEQEKCRYFDPANPTQRLATVNNPHACDKISEPPSLNPHSCMLVKLTSGSLNFLNDSVYRNMDFATHSTSVRDAEINLPVQAGGTRNVYLVVDKRNMPSKIKLTRPSVKTSTVEVGERSAISELNTKADFVMEAIKKGKMLNIDYEELSSVMPTYVVHTFQDTGKELFIDGHRHTVLNQGTSFGYFAMHEGDIEGWSDSMSGVQVTGVPHIYKVTVPQNPPFAMIRISTKAIEPPLVLLKKYLIKRPDGWYVKQDYLKEINQADRKYFEDNGKIKMNLLGDRVVKMQYVKNGRIIQQDINKQ